MRHETNANAKIPLRSILALRIDEFFKDKGIQ